MTTKKKKLKVLSLFSGCGGMDLGFEGGFPVLGKSINAEITPELYKECKPQGKWVNLPETKFKTVFANDILPAAKSAWIPFFRNRGHAASEFQLASIVDLVKSHEIGHSLFPQADVVTGGFPCQDFSIAGKRKGFRSQKGHHGKLLTNYDSPTEENRGMLYMWMRKVIERTEPKVFVAENVKGLVSLANAKKIIENDFRNIGSGYLVVDAQVLYAPTYGIPQNRERVIFIGFRKDALTKEACKELVNLNSESDFYPYPEQTHGSSELPIYNRGNLLPYVTVGDYILDLGEPQNSQDLSHQTFSKAKWYGKHCQGQIEVDLGGIGPTIRAEHHGNIEFRRLAHEHGGRYSKELDLGLQERRLTVRECARIQTFPDNYEFVRKGNGKNDPFKISGSDGYRLVGNAVPPFLAFHVAWKLQSLWHSLFR